MIPIPFLAFMIFFINMSLKHNLESSIRPKCFCSLTFGTTDSLKKRDG